MSNEKRLIDANALGIGKAKREAFDNPAYADGWNSAIEIIENAPHRGCRGSGAVQGL